MADQEEKTKAGTVKDPKPAKKKGVVKGIKFSFNKELKRPEFKDDKKKGWVVYGEKNLFPDFLLSAYFKSGKHNSIINRKIKMVAGNGFTIKEGDQYTNPHGDFNADKTAKLLESDQEIFKGFCCFLRWNDTKTKVVAYDYLPWHKVRRGITEEGEYNGFWVSNDWTKINKKEGKPVFYNEFDGKPGLSKEFRKLPKNTDEQKKKREEALERETVEVKYFSDISVGTDAYPIPNYFASIPWILTDGEIGTFSYNLAKKNFLGGFHIGFHNGIPEDDERQKAKKDFKSEYGGTAGEDIIITFNEPEGKKVSFDPLPSAGNENIFENTETRAQENIFIAHEVVNPVLFGIRESAGLGKAKDELSESLAIFQAVYIDEKQKNIEDFFNEIFVAMGKKEDAELSIYSFDSKKKVKEEV